MIGFKGLASRPEGKVWMRWCPAAVMCVLNTAAYRAPTLFRRFGSAGEVAVDLLARLLSFDPVRRCSSEVRSHTPPAGNE